MSERLELRREVYQLARHDFGTFFRLAWPILNPEPLMENWHLDVLSREAQCVALGKTPRLLIMLPPRYGKTQTFSILLPAWELGRDPSATIICASYSGALAEKFSGDTLKLMHSPLYQCLFPHTVLKKTSATEITTTAGGFRFATSVGGTLTGRGAQQIIIDDPLNAAHAHSPTERENCIDWFNRTVHTRLNNPQKGAIVVVAQRLHAEDLPGHLIEVGGWREIVIPAIAWEERHFEFVEGGVLGILNPGRVLQPERHSLEDLEQLKRTMGEHDFEAQFNQRPLPPGGATFKTSWLQRYDEPPRDSMIEYVVQSWDTAYEGGEHNDYSVCTTWAVCSGRFFLLDVWRGKPAFWELEKKVFELRKKWKAQLVIVEKAASGISLAQNIRARDRQLWLETIQPTPPKLERAQQQTPKFEQGRIYLPSNAEWLPAYENELLSFPFGKHDDQVDATVNFLTAFDVGTLAQRAQRFRIVE